MSSISQKVSKIVVPDEVEAYVTMPDYLLMCDKEVIEV